jgi:hypothetical protein
MAPDCTFSAGYNFNDIIMCTAASFGFSFEIIALGIIMTFVLFALYARLDFDISLGLATALTWALMMAGGNAIYMLQVIFVILLVGLALRVFMAILGILRQ